jgi:hypothetical protein
VVHHWHATSDDIQSCIRRKRMARCRPSQAAAIACHLKEYRSALLALVHVSAALALAVDPTFKLTLITQWPGQRSGQSLARTSVYLVLLIAFASLIWHGAVSKACEKGSCSCAVAVKKRSLSESVTPLQVSCLQHVAVTAAAAVVISKYSSGRRRS